MGLKDYIAKIPVTREEHFQRIGEQNVRENIELKTSAMAPVPEADDKRFFEPNEGAWDSFVRGDDGD